MNRVRQAVDEHLEHSRRYFLGLGAAGAAGLATSSLWAEDGAGEDALRRLIAELEYLTPPLEFRSVERGNPLPYKLPPEKRREVGMERETWKLEVVPDKDTPAIVRNPLSVESGNPFTFDDLMKMARTRAVRFLKLMTCNNIGRPLGMGLWEGVPLRHVVWKARPESHVRRAFYYGYHNDAPEQMFRSSLSIGRVLEDPPGMHPVILAYKLNGKLLSGVRGGPVRLIVPEAYGFKSVKWLTHVVLTDLYHANDTYATQSPNDIDSKMKTFARFLHRPPEAKSGTPIPLTGMAQVGMSGLRRIQYWVCPSSTELPQNDPHLTTAPWKDAAILPAPTSWGGGLPEDRLPANVRGFDPGTGEARRWPLPYAMAHWAVLLDGLPAGEHDVRCRTIDANGVAQPMPRPFRKSGRNAIDVLSIMVKA